MAEKEDPTLIASADAEVDIVDLHVSPPEEEQRQLTFSPDPDNEETLPIVRHTDSGPGEPIGLDIDLGQNETSPTKSDGSGDSIIGEYLRSPTQAEGDEGADVLAATSAAPLDEELTGDSFDEGDDGMEAEHSLPERPGSRAGFHDDNEDSEDQEVIPRFPQAIEDDEDQTVEARESASGLASASAHEDKITISPALETAISDFAKTDFSIPTTVNTGAVAAPSSKVIDTSDKLATEDDISDLNDFNSRVKRPIHRVPAKYLMDRKPEEVLDEQRFSLMGAPTLESTESLVAGLVGQYNPGHVKIFNRGLEIYYQKAVENWQKFQVELMRANALHTETMGLVDSLNRLTAQMLEEQKLGQRIKDDSEAMELELEEALTRRREQEDANEAAHKAAVDIQEQLEVDLKMAEARSRHFRQQSDAHLAALEKCKRQAGTHQQSPTSAKNELQSAIEKHQGEMKAYQDGLDQLREVVEWQKNKIAECEKEKEILNKRRPESDYVDVGTSITSPIRPKYKGVPLSPTKPSGIESLWTDSDKQALIRTLRAQNETLSKEVAEQQKAILECKRSGTQTPQPEGTDSTWTIEDREEMIAELRETVLELTQEIESLRSQAKARISNDAKAQPETVNTAWTIEAREELIVDLRENVLELTEEIESLQKQVKAKTSNDAKAGPQPEGTHNTRTTPKPKPFAVKPANSKMARGSWPGAGTNEDHLRNQLHQRDRDLASLVLGYDELERKLQESEKQAAEAWDFYQNLKKKYHSSPARYETDEDEDEYENHEIAVLVKENTALRKQLTTSAKSLETQQSINVKLNLEHKTLVKQLAVSSHEVELHGARNAEVDARNHAQAAALQGLRSEHGQLKAQHAELDARKTSQDTELRRMRDELEQLRAAYFELRTRERDQRTELRRTSFERDQLNTACLKSETDRLGQTSELRRARSQHERLKTRYADLDGRYSRLDAECSLMRDKLARGPGAPSSAAVLVAKENEILQQQLAKAQKELKDAQALIKQLNGRLNHQAFPPPPPTPQKATARSKPLTLGPPRGQPVTHADKPRHAPYPGFAPPTPQPTGWGNAPECYQSPYTPHYASSSDSDNTTRKNNNNNHNNKTSKPAPLTRFPSDGYEIDNMYESERPSVVDMDPRTYGHWSEGYDRRFAAQTEYLEREFGIESTSKGGGRAGFGRQSPTRVLTGRILTGQGYGGR